MDWINENYQPLSLLTNIFLLLIWAIYAGLLYREYARQHQAHLVVQVTDRRLDQAECLLISLSPDPVHIRALIVSAVDGSHSYHVTEPQDGAGPSLRAESLLRQGPLRSGDFLTVGSIRRLLAPLAGDWAERGNSEVRVEMRIVFEQQAGKLFGARHDLGARNVDGHWRVVSASQFTEQLTSRSERKEVTAWLDAVENPMAPGPVPDDGDRLEREGHTHRRE